MLDISRDDGPQALPTDHVMSESVNDDYAIQIDRPISTSFIGAGSLQQPPTLSTSTQPLNNTIMPSIEGVRANVSEQQLLRSSPIFQPLQQAVVSLPTGSEDIYADLMVSTTSTIPLQISQIGSLSQDALSYFGNDYFSSLYQDNVDVGLDSTILDASLTIQVFGTLLL